MRYITICFDSLEARRHNSSGTGGCHGRIQDFLFFFGGGGGAGGAKDYVRARTLRARNPMSLSARVKGPLKGPGSSRVFYCSLVLSEALFLSILLQIYIKNIVDQNQILGWGRLLRPFLEPPLCYLLSLRVRAIIIVYKT